MISMGRKWRWQAVMFDIVDMQGDMQSIAVFFAIGPLRICVEGV
jgi:hypothetical protein